jgi:hypothetical protein
MQRELSQNLKTVLQEVGEGAALLRLSIELYDKPRWRVYRNYAENGCDIVIVGPKRKIKVEVKSRQKLIASRKRRSVHFRLTENEKKAADFVVGYWFERAAFFVVPTTKLTKARSSGKSAYRFIAYYSDKLGDFTEPSKKYLENWQLILNKTR